MPGKAFASTPGLGTVSKGAIDAQRAIDEKLLLAHDQRHGHQDVALAA